MTRLSDASKYAFKLKFAARIFGLLLAANLVSVAVAMASFLVAPCRD